MTYPKKLNLGDTIGLVCLSSNISKDREVECKAVLEAMGYQVKLADNLTANHAGYMAGTGKVRGESLNAMFADPAVDAIFCVRGGHGGARAMEYLDYDIIRANPKIFVGYSDITSMHCGIANHCDFVTFHGPMVSSNMVGGLTEEELASFFGAINADQGYQFANPQGIPIQTLQGGCATGTLVGGNLALLSATIGTSYEVDTKGKILFMEEVEETLPRIDRFAYQLKNAGKFQDCAGVMLGQFTDCTNKDDPSYLALDFFKELLAEFDIPVVYNVQSGHGDVNMTLPFGALCTMDADAKTIAFAKPERV